MSACLRYLLNTHSAGCFFSANGFKCVSLSLFLSASTLNDMFRTISVIRVPSKPGNQENLGKDLLFPVREKSGNLGKVSEIRGKSRNFVGQTFPTCVGKSIQLKQQISLHAYGDGGFVVYM